MAVLALPAEAIRIEEVEDRVWEREWLKDFRPMRFGRRLWVCPGGQPPGEPSAPARMRRQPCAWSGWTASRSQACVYSTLAAGPASLRSLRSSSALRSHAPSTSIRRPLAPDLARLCPAGTLLLAGQLDAQAAEVADAYSPWFDIETAARRDGWIALIGHRRAE